MLFLVSVGSLLAPFPAAAETAWTVRSQVLLPRCDCDRDRVFPNHRDQLHLASGKGLALSIEGRPRAAWGVALGIARLELDGDYRAFFRFGPRPQDEEIVFSSRGGTFVLVPFTLGALWHAPLGGSRVDLNLGAHAAWVRYDVDVRGAPRRDDEPGIAGTIGLDVRGRGRWGFSGEVRYLKAFHETVERDLYGDLGVYVAQLGASYRFPR